ncbi:hypothetical protein IZ6_07780 [Terrihabitans soli]|uniref:Uncharacterized protein n=1 Tax=Terrihabitans soli TaxID=708113 RepID=A0A6S6QG12_9HYPH|nr:hypothetical protein [Terrihabitans soli]BCJ90043.1 hypothetical protein IZ6_07780 [Terrihabitans soli]
MAVFQDFKFNWKGVDYSIPSNRIMGAIELVEDVITIDKLYEVAASGGMKLTRIARAYGQVMRYAGVTVEHKRDDKIVREPVTDEEVYAGLFDGAETKANIMGSLNGLLSLMLPPGSVKEPAGRKKGNRKSRRASSSSSRRRTKPR